ncbi:UPF0481 protein At3g47200-like [Carya illinoinensis]|uniref:Uncharacterized protein n=1 Tax=Carya illinoinensis TaxID=32201 RepID=A0A8T1RLW7_CARIL|nr:UPF0481 protein At3g47200-like [Carya illinoinensis]XP_042988989.1 UPF0481 protein At3g47200-like [Carya illinoinensis]XP_042988998.1 UPF0481 protein At3g47200-like [Carya illinoinensis]XP_042989007.1 UPF0481 protein At3g47200-like [Carya illinoinensis]XP_042989014.1 UPF0481 protein At3g47200-like [Carya illinoinensis]XP_042989024.1 UPF0481 protein At3g47200-like [Carya illinoinensis]XP_042989033.1 UPF0481 protein At3g47200-like [Carya illinoinensis]XP_042989043.1 UPF0481 protein At3g4720
MTSSDLSISIDGMLKGSTPSGPECCIFKLHPHLRDVNDKAYEPLLLAIGPYNHGKDGLKRMEEHKLQYLRQMTQRRKENSVDRYIKALRQLEGKARKCYAESISQTSDEFVKMMLLDGCFIIELFRKVKKLKEIRTQRDEHDPIFQLNWMRDGILRDLLLFENQLPFFVLTKLFEMTGSGEGKSELFQLAFDFLSVPTLIQGTIKVPGNDSIDETTADPVPPKDATTSSREEMVDKYKMAVQRLHNGELKHLLDLIHTGISFSVFDMDKNHAIVRQEAGGKFKKLSETVKHLSGYFKNRKVSEKEEIEDWTLMHSAIELHEAGVKFHKAEEGNIFGIKFNNGKLEVPPLTIDDNTETHLRNLIAYEQYSQEKADSHYATDYMCFLDDLMH